MLKLSLSIFSRHEGQTSASRGSGPAAAESQCGLRSWSSQVELAEKFEKDIVTNLVRGLPADCHQRSLSLLVDSHTTLPITSPWTPFPINLARTHHRLQSPVSHHLISTHTINTGSSSQSWLLTSVSMFLSFAFLVF